jgi:hypothetical protein
MLKFQNDVPDGIYMLSVESEGVGRLPARFGMFVSTRRGVWGKSSEWSVRRHTHHLKVGRHAPRRSLWHAHEISC